MKGAEYVCVECALALGATARQLSRGDRLRLALTFGPRLRCASCGSKRVSAIRSETPIPVVTTDEAVKGSGASDDRRSSGGKSGDFDTLIRQIRASEEELRKKQASSTGRKKDGRG